METPTETIKGYYQEDFMGPVEMLCKIYVPINDAHVHWYLLVVDFDAKAHYSGFFTMPIKKGMQKRSSEEIDTAQPLVSDFDIMEIEGLPVQLDGSNDCGVWVALWMTKTIMSDDYKNISVSPSTRMRIALDLVLGDFNRIKDTVEKLAFKYWNDKVESMKKRVKMP
ncbi:Ulp1 protease family, C-terminal catalytic domain [Sesbania bispinosa]|nr:Ulp1 protease family, C-terminal catalytic domain [Sesbania bispinosa]